MKGLLFSSLSLGASSFAQVTDIDLLKSNPNNWLNYSGSYDSKRHTALKQIDTSNVGTLMAKWNFHVPGSHGLGEALRPVIARTGNCQNI